jgi:hypothetical protein
VGLRVRGHVFQVSVYLGRGGFSFRPAQTLTGSEIYARYGSAIAALGDLDMDGYNGKHITHIWTHTTHTHLDIHTLNTHIWIYTHYTHTGNYTQLYIHTYV